MESFSELTLSEPLARAIAELGYVKPSPIQVETLPILLGDDTDFLGLASTGSGKTAAFGIPLLEKIDAKQKVIQAIILCPTRELALQVSGQIDLLGKYMNIRSVAVYGGSSYGDQIRGIKQGAQIMVGTPGRVIDHLERRTLSLEDVKTVVLDEADEMISMGFKEELESILSKVDRENSKTWLFSATMSMSVRKVSSEYLTNPKKVEINRTEMLPSTIEQYYYMTREGNKPEILCKLIDAAEDFYGLVFCQTKTLVVDLAQFMSDRGYKVDTLHGDKSQDMRERTMRSFRERKIRVLICTDVASRGLDVKDITHVVNYSLPRELDNYVHRIGRTARSGKKGIAMSLVTPTHRMLVSRIEQKTKSRMTEGQVPTRRDIGSKKIGQMVSKFQEQTGFARAVQLLDDNWKTALEGMSAEEVAGRFLSLMVPDVFQVDAERPQISRDQGDRRSQERPRSGGGASYGRSEPRRDDRRDDRREPRREARRDDRWEGRREERRPVVSAPSRAVSAPARAAAATAKSEAPARREVRRTPRFEAKGPTEHAPRAPRVDALTTPVKPAAVRKPFYEKVARTGGGPEAGKPKTRHPRGEGGFRPPRKPSSHSPV